MKLKTFEGGSHPLVNWPDSASRFTVPSLHVTSTANTPVEPTTPDKVLFTPKSSTVAIETTKIGSSTTSMTSEEVKLANKPVILVAPGVEAKSPRQIPDQQGLEVKSATDVLLEEKTTLE